MIERPALVVAVAVLVLFAGCSAIGGDSGGDSTTEPPPRTTFGVPETTTTAEDPFIIAYDDLPDGDRQFFRELVVNGSSAAPPPRLSRLYPPNSPDFVSWQGELYDISAVCGGFVNTYAVRSVAELDESAVGENRTVISYDSLPEGDRKIFTEALANSSADDWVNYWEDQFPDDFETGTVVEYRGSYYELTILNAKSIKCWYSVDTNDE